MDKHKLKDFIDAAKEVLKGTGIVALLLGMWLNYCHCDLI